MKAITTLAFTVLLLAACEKTKSTVETKGTNKIDLAQQRTEVNNYPLIGKTKQSNLSARGIPGSSVQVIDLGKSGSLFKSLIIFRGRENNPVLVFSRAPIVNQRDFRNVQAERPSQFIDAAGNQIFGKLGSRTAKKSTPTPGAQARDGESGQLCIDWFWIIINEETGEVVDEIFIETKCYDQGGGDGGPLPTVCTMTEQEAEAALNATSIISLADYSETDGAITDQNDRIVKPKVIEWNFARLTNPLFSSLTWAARFKGVVYKNNARDYWKWDNFEYVNFAAVGGWVPPCVEATLNMGGVAHTISTDKKTAQVALNYDVHLKINCVIGFKVNHTSGSNFQIFDAN